MFPIKMHTTSNLQPHNSFDCSHDWRQHRAWKMIQLNSDVHDKQQTSLLSPGDTHSINKCPALHHVLLSELPSCPGGACREGYRGKTHAFSCVEWGAYSFHWATWDGKKWTWAAIISPIQGQLLWTTSYQILSARGISLNSLTGFLDQKFELASCI